MGKRPFRCFCDEGINVDTQFEGRSMTIKTAALYRMVMPSHLCPFGLKAKALLERQGYQVEDHWLRSREEVDAFKAAHQVATTPRVFIGGEPVGGYDDLRQDRASTGRAELLAGRRGVRGNRADGRGNE
jgi:glutaredoxin